MCQIVEKKKTNLEQVKCLVKTVFVPSLFRQHFLFIGKPFSTNFWLDVDFGTRSSVSTYFGSLQHLIGQTIEKPFHHFLLRRQTLLVSKKEKERFLKLIWHKFGILTENIFIEWAGYALTPGTLAKIWDTTPAPTPTGFWTVCFFGLTF